MKMQHKQHTAATLDQFLSKFPTPKRVRVSSTSLHPSIHPDVIFASGTISFKKQVTEIFTPNSARFFIRKHPPEAILTSDGTALCFAGFRSYQMAHSCIPDDEIFILIHDELTENDIRTLAIYDLYLTYLGLSSDDRLWPVDLGKIWQQLSKEDLEILTPRLIQKKQLSRELNVTYQRLFPARKLKKKHLQKRTNKKQTLFPISDKKNPADEKVELEKMLEKAIAENNIVHEIAIKGKLLNRSK